MRFDSIEMSLDLIHFDCHFFLTECDSLQDGLPGICLSPTLSPRGPLLQGAVPVRGESQGGRPRQLLLGGAQVLHSCEGGDEAPAEHLAEEGGGNRVSFQELA